MFECAEFMEVETGIVNEHDGYRQTDTLYNQDAMQNEKLKPKEASDTFMKSSNRLITYSGYVFSLCPVLPFRL